MDEKKYETIRLGIEKKIATVCLHRPAVHNAFNEKMLSELIDVFTALAGAGDEVRAVVVTGAGKTFCAGADLNWMRDTLECSYEENLADSLRVSECMYALYSLPKPVLGKINGAAYGGGMGLVSACDIVIAQENAAFSLSEVKLGLVPACISPYVLKKAGEGACKELFLSGERFTAQKAHRVGLVNAVVPADMLDEEVERRLDQLRKNGPAAMGICKKLLETVAEMELTRAKQYTAEVLSQIRGGEEGQEGMRAFLEKRAPHWRMNEE